MLAYGREYYKRNYLVNKEKILEHNRKYAKENPETMAKLQTKI